VLAALAGRDYDRTPQQSAAALDVDEHSIGAMDPRRAILPIFELCETREPVALAGTGFLLGPPTTLVTAGHVLKTPLPDGHSFGVAFPSANGPTLARLAPGNIRFSRRWDVAAVPRTEHPDLQTFKLQPQRLPETDDVVAFDYSGTRFELREGRRHAILEPLTHKGNLMRWYACDAPGWEGMPAWDTSFPALQGASGAPVMALRSGGIVGMLLANRERHLVPAQVVRIQSADGELEDVKYYLPIGLAIRAVAIGEFLQELGIDVNTVMMDGVDADI
jgi:Trypsin-like peptidase domain